MAKSNRPDESIRAKQYIGSGSSPHGRNQWSDIGRFTDSPDWLSQVLGTGRADDGSINNKAAQRGSGFTNKEQAEMYSSYMSTQEERQWNESMYQKYQSYSGQVEQMKAAGLNPAMMFGGSPSAGAVGDTAAADMSTSSSSDDILSQSGFSGVLQMIGTLLGLTRTGADVSKIGSDIHAQSVANNNNTIIAESEAARNESETRKNDAIAQSYENENDIFTARWNLERASKELENAQKALNLDLTSQNIEESKARITRMETASSIEAFRASTEYESAMSEIAQGWARYGLEARRTSAYENLTDAQIENIAQVTRGVIKDNANKDFRNKLNAMKESFGVDDDTYALYIYTAYERGDVDAASRLLSLYDRAMKSNLRESTSGQKTMRQLIDVGGRVICSAIASHATKSKVTSSFATGDIPDFLD